MARRFVITDQAGPPPGAPFVVDPQSRTIKINTARDNAGGPGALRSATDAEINAALTAAMADKFVTDYGTGITPMDSAATAAYEAFASHPNTGNTLRLGTAVLQISGGIVAILTPSGVTQVIGVYSLAVGTDEAIAALQGLYWGEHIRSSREQGVDYFTQDQQLTDKLIFVTDLGIDGFDAYQASRAWMKNRKAVSKQFDDVMVEFWKNEDGAIPEGFIPQHRTRQELADAVEKLRNAPNNGLGQLQGKFDALAERHLLPKYRALDPDLKFGYTGSFKTGTVGNPTKPTFGQPIDLSKFDVDVWIESDILYKKFGSNLKADVEFRKLLSETLGFEGLKPHKAGFSIMFKPCQSE